MSQIEAALREALKRIAEYPRASDEGLTDFGIGDNRSHERSAMVQIARAALSQQSPAPSPDDGERLQWMQFHGAQVAWGNDGEVCTVRWGDRDGSYQTALFYDWRKAIDAARAGEFKETVGASPAPSVEPPDFEAIAWAVQKLTAFGVANNTMDNALMMDRLEFMLKFPDAAPTAAVHEPEARDQGHPDAAMDEGKESGLTDDHLDALWESTFDLPLPLPTGTVMRDKLRRRVFARAVLTAAAK